MRAWTSSMTVKGTLALGLAVFGVGWVTAPTQVGDDPVRPGAFTPPAIAGSYSWSRTDSTGAVTGSVTEAVVALVDGATLRRDQRFDDTKGNELFAMSTWIDAVTWAPRRVHITSPAGVVGRIEFTPDSITAVHLAPFGRPLRHAVGPAPEAGFEWTTGGGWVVAAAFLDPDVDAIELATIMTGPGTSLLPIENVLSLTRGPLETIGTAPGATWEASRIDGDATTYWVRDQTPYLVGVRSGTSMYVLEASS